MFQFVIPTYNERENVEELVPVILDLFQSSQILIVDDNSPDGTGAWCDQFALSEPRFSVLHRHAKDGIGAATCEGLMWSLDQNMPWIVTMDADLSHDPHDLHRITREIDDAVAQVWVGSRYCEYGRIQDWPWHRRVLSQSVNRISKFCLRLTVSDYSSAYRVYHRKALEAVGLEAMKSRGYAYLEEILFKLHRLDFKFREFPICFKDRNKGNSKANVRQSLRAAYDLARLFVTSR
ncbi:MAG TPA: polyprenol monophosphomannose synthase [Pirellulaceae bacterium]|nr:polyprenol monophosphomannose synthase [Pirellulaceae bacterium]HMO90810.1 polyprenol monophosphomannose synthase [Pirellulaceae bacterium]HMP68061.1 polyprenol monophosphomannose synthase [Pirellulaceae bacterium]